jgi:predicted GNAT family acetyltransferase
MLWYKVVLIKGMEIKDNKDRKRYEWSIENSIAFIDYIKAGETIYLTHTEVPKTLEGKGIGSQLVAAALKEVEKEGLRLIPLCPFVALFIKKNPDWKRLVYRGINIG